MFTGVPLAKVAVASVIVPLTTVKLYTKVVPNMFSVMVTKSTSAAAKFGLLYPVKLLAEYNPV
jgi:hypothetical protein